MCVCEYSSAERMAVASCVSGKREALSDADFVSVIDLAYGVTRGRISILPALILAACQTCLKSASTYRPLFTLPLHGKQTGFMGKLTPLISGNQVFLLKGMRVKGNHSLQPKAKNMKS
jgi:hypothetical protein